MAENRNGMFFGRSNESSGGNPTRSMSIFVGEAEKVPWGSDGFLPDSADNVEYDAIAVGRVKKMEKTAYKVYFALRIAVEIMLAAFKNNEEITPDMQKPIKIRVSHVFISISYAPRTTSSCQLFFCRWRSGQTRRRSWSFTHG